MMNEKHDPQLSAALAILARDPNNSGAHIQAGVLFSQIKAWDYSALHLKKALRSDKKNPLILQKLSDVLVEGRKPREAMKFARKLIDIKKKDPDALLAMVKVHEALGEVARALHLIDQVLTLRPNDLATLYQKADLLSSEGKMDDALALHEDILNIDPNYTRSIWKQIQLQKLEKQEAQPKIERLEKISDMNRTKDELQFVHYALGKANQDIGEYGKAFENFELANQQNDVDVAPDRIIAANINFRETYTPQMFASKAKLGNYDHRPIFILGMARSGTTLTESLCAAHSKVSAGGEQHYLMDFNKNLKLYSTIENGHRSQIEALDKKSLRELSQTYITNTAHMTEKGTRLTDKLPHNFLNIGLIALLYPNAKIIHCRRHPLDNCLSIFSNPLTDYHKEYKSNLKTLGEYFRNYVQIMQYWKEVCPIPIHDVFYEDLVANTQSVARGMIDYLGFDWEEGVLDRDGSQRTVKTLSVWQVRQPVYQSSKGKWRNFDKQLEPLRQAMGDYVESYEQELAELDNRP